MKICFTIILLISITCIAGGADSHASAIMHHPAFASETGMQSAFVRDNFSVEDGRADVLLSHKPGWIPPQNAFVSYDRNGIAILRIELVRLPALVDDPDVLWIEASSRCDPTCDVSVPETGAPSVWASPDGGGGEGAIVGILDTGIDFDHDDFLDEFGGNRIMAIWDQAVEGDVLPAGFGYGMLWDAGDIEEGLCTEEDFYGHGTHCTGIAAGYDIEFMGMAPAAEILVCKAGNYYFYSHNIANGFAWLTDFADERGQPISVNMSLGGGYGPHDGSLLYERVMARHTGPGKILSIAAGNSRGNKRHYQFEITPTVGDTLHVQVDPFSNPGTLDDYIFISGWFDGDDSIIVNVRSPHGHHYGPIYPGDDVVFGSDGDGFVWLDNSSFGPSPNGDRCFTFILVDADSSEPPAAGEWSIIYSGEGIVHGWLYAASMSVSFSDDDVTNTHILGPPGTMPEAITVASYATKSRWVNAWGDTSSRGGVDIGELSSFSSPGPNRNGLQKPDIAAPGQLVAAARSTSADFSGWWCTHDGEHTVMQGTSMATPHVTGAIALLLQSDPTLTPDMVRELLSSTAVVDSFVGTAPNRDWGAGKMAIGEAFDAIEPLDARPLLPGIALSDTGYILVTNNYFAALPEDVSEITIGVNVLSGGGNLKLRYGEMAGFSGNDTSITLATGYNELILDASCSAPPEPGDVYLRVECLWLSLPYEITLTWESDYDGNRIDRVIQTALDTIYIEFGEIPTPEVTDLSHWAIIAEGETIAISAAALDSNRLTFALAEEIEVGKIVTAYYHDLAELFDSGFEFVETLWPIHDETIYYDAVWSDTTWPHYLGRVTIKPSGSLTIMPGVEIHSLFWTSLLTIQGQLQILGTPECPVVFDVRDGWDSWGGIEFSNNRTPREIFNTRIEDATTGLHIKSGELDIVGLEIRNTITGVKIAGGADFTARNLLVSCANSDTAEFINLAGIWAIKGGVVDVINATFDSIYYAAISVDTVESLYLSNTIFTRCGAGADIRELWPASLDYCCFWDNGVDTWGPIDVGSHNIYTNPAFIGGDPIDYHLSALSPCIDMGDPAILDPDTTRSDIGAYGGDFGTNIDESIDDLPREVALRAYPNPFNAHCAIELGKIEIPVVIEIYDLSGKLVREIRTNRTLTVWDGTDDCGKPLSSGIYLIRVDNANVSAKIVLLK